MPPREPYTDEELLAGKHGYLTFEDRLRKQTLVSKRTIARGAAVNSQTLDALTMRLQRVRRELQVIEGAIRLHEKMQARRGPAS